MWHIYNHKRLLLVLLVLSISGCAYFNTFYNAQQYFKEAEKIRLTKDGKSISVSAMDKYGKTVKKCETILSDYPDSKYIIDARLLMGKARYYRSEYDLAIDDLNEVKMNGVDNQIDEASYWQALCKAKKGSVQSALNELNRLLKESNSEDIIAMCHRSLANLYEENNDYDVTLFHLKRAGELTKVSGEKALIYDKIAQKAFDSGDYDLSMNSYDMVTTNSLSKEKIEHSHLQILKILRIQKKYDKAEKKIKSLLTNDKFNRISGELELELVQLYRAQGENSEIETRLESIVNDYQRTAVSAEAYYQLGQIYTSEKWNLDKAKEYFDMVSKEYSRSLFSPLSKGQGNAIMVYKKALEDILLHENIIDAINKKETMVDSIEMSASLENPPSRGIPELYYQIADLEAFSFNRYDESVEYLNKIINNHPSSEFVAKARFALIYVYDVKGDTISTMKAKENLMNFHPFSEYSYYLNDSIKMKPSIQKTLMFEAESQANINRKNAIQLYKNAINADSVGIHAASAAFSVGYFYDQEAILDSAIKYYSWVNIYHPNSEHAKKAKNRINVLNDVIEIIQPDTSEKNITVEN